MALFHVSMRSNSMGMSTNLYVTLPSDTSGIPEGGYPVMYLLHGMSDDHTKWLRATRIEEYAAKYNMCVVMPEGQISFYCNMAYGLPYDDYITKDLPEFIEKTFPVTHEREKTFIAGLSMGGYGALKSGIREYEKFGACAGLSSAINLFGSVSESDDHESYIYRIARGIKGDGLITPERDDLYKLTEKLAALPKEKRTRIYFTVGTEDFLYKDNLDFKAHLDRLGIEYAFEADPGSHSWDYWDVHIRHALKFFFEGSL